MLDKYSKNPLNIYTYIVYIELVNLTQKLKNFDPYPNSKKLLRKLNEFQNSIQNSFNAHILLLFDFSFICTHINIYKM